MIARYQFQLCRVLKGDKTLNVNANTKDMIWNSAKRLGYKTKT